MATAPRLPSLKRDMQMTPAQQGRPLVAEENPITTADEKEFNREPNAFFHSPEAREFVDVLPGMDRVHIIQQIKPEEVTQFVHNEPYKRRVLTEIAQDVADNKDLEDAMDDAGITAKIGNPLYALTADDLADISLIYENMNMLPRLGYIMAGDAEIRHKINRDDMKMIEFKESMEEANPARLVDLVLDNLMVYAPTDPGERAQFEKDMRNIKEGMHQNEIKLQKGYISSKEYGRMYDRYQTLFRNVLNNKAMFTALTKQLRHQIYVDANIVNNYIKKISAWITKYPNNTISKHLDTKLNTELNSLRTGKISLTQFFNNLNALGKMMKPQIEAEEKGGVHRDLKVSPIYEDVKEKEEYPEADAKVKDTYIKNALGNGKFAFEGFILKYPGGKTDDHISDKENHIYGVIQPEVDTIAQDVVDMLKIPTKVAKGRSALSPSKIAPTTGTKTFDGIGNINSMKLTSLEDLRDSIKSFLTKSRMVNLNTNMFKSLNDAHYNSLSNTDKVSLMRAEFNDLRDALHNIRDWTTSGGAKAPINFGTVGRVISAWKVPPVKHAAPVDVLKTKVTMLQKPVELHQTEKFEDEGLTAEEKAENKRRREKKYAQENLVYARKVTKEEPETNKAFFGKNVIEYDVKSETDLTRMKFEVSKMEGDLYILDLKSGRLYPISLQHTFAPQTYIFMKKSYDKKGGSFGAFATHLAQQRIFHDEPSLLPFRFMREGNDKIVSMAHKLPVRENPTDYREQIRHEMGGNLWKHIRKGISNVASATTSIIPGINIAYSLPPVHKVANKAGNVYLDKVEHAGVNLYDQTKKEGANFVNQSKQNINSIYMANKGFYNNPNIKTFGNAYLKTNIGLSKLALQPAISTAREGANVSDFVAATPGGMALKTGVEYTLPPLAVADGLAHAARASGVGSDDKTNYLDTAIGLGDAVIGSGTLKGSLQTGARLINYSLKAADAITDSSH